MIRYPIVDTYLDDPLGFTGKGRLGEDLGARTVLRGHKKGHTDEPLSPLDAALDDPLTWEAGA